MIKQLALGIVGIISLTMVVAVAHAQKGGKKGPAGKGDAAGGNAGAPAPLDNSNAEPPMAQEPPKPSAETEAGIKALTGTWKCKGVLKAFMGMPEKPTVSTMKWKKDADGFWITGVYEEKKTKENPTPYKFTQHRMFDAATNKWVATSIDNMGGSSTTQTTSVVDNTKTWEGKSTMSGQTAWGRSVEEMVSAKEIKLTGDVSLDGKNWTPIYEVVCKK
jgi:hypothetical protein